MTSRTSGSDRRFSVPLYSVAEAARYLGVPATTFNTWARGYVRRSPGHPDVVADPVVTALPRHDSDAVVPFIGLAEGLVLAAIRRAGVPLQRIRPALNRLHEEFGLAHVLASQRLYSDGAEVLYDYADKTGDVDTVGAVRDLVVVRSGQRVFNEIVTSYLRRVEFASDGYARLIYLPRYPNNEVVVDPERAFGLPIFRRGAARVEDVLSRFKAGEDPEDLAEDFGVPREHLLDVLRVLTPAA